MSQYESNVKNGTFLYETASFYDNKGSISAKFNLDYSNPEFLYNEIYNSELIDCIILEDLISKEKSVPDDILVRLSLSSLFPVERTFTNKLVGFEYKDALIDPSFHKFTFNDSTFINKNIIGITNE